MGGGESHKYSLLQGAAHLTFNRKVTHKKNYKIPYKLSEPTPVIKNDRSLTKIEF